METVYDESLPVLERIKVPMVWERLDCGVRVEDLQEDRFDEALEITKVFIEDDPMCVGCRLSQEKDSMEEFLALVRLWMQDTQSFLAVEEESGAAVGLLVGRAQDRWSHTKTMSRMRILQTEALGKMQRFQAHIHRQVDLFTQFRTEAYFKVYVWCVVKDYRDKGIGHSLLRTALQQTRSYKMPVVMGVFTGAVSQHIAETMGFQGLVDILYWTWKEGDEPVFDNPGAGNSSASLMVYVIEENLAPSEHSEVEAEEWGEEGEGEEEEEEGEEVEQEEEKKEEKKEEEEEKKDEDKHEDNVSKK